MRRRLETCRQLIRRKWTPSTKLRLRLTDRSCDPLTPRDTMDITVQRMTTDSTECDPGENPIRLT
jgi:hypothetical protein